jgi:hypothetical protein
MAEMALLLFMLPVLAAAMMMSERRDRESRLFLLPQRETARRLWPIFCVPLGITSGLCLASGVAALLLRAIVGGVPASAIAGAALALLPGAVCGLALGCYFSLLCRDVFSAAGLALLATAAVSLAPVWLGPAISAMPGGAALIPPLLASNPFVGLASAMDFDLFRTEPLYWISPVARRRFDYPSIWTVASVLGLASWLLCWRCVARIRRMAEPSD